MSINKEYLAKPFPSGVKSPVDQKDLKVIRENILGDSSTSFVAKACLITGKVFQVVVPEEEIFGIAEEARRREAIKYWSNSGVEGYPCECLEVLLSCFEILVREKEGRELLEECDYIIFAINILLDLEPEGFASNCFQIQRADHVLVIAFTHSYLQRPIRPNCEALYAALQAALLLKRGGEH